MIIIKEINDKQLWQDFLDNTYSGFYPFFQTWNWGEVEKRRGFPIMRYGVFEDAVLVGIFLIIDVKARRGHYLHLRHGPVLQHFERDFDRVMDFVKRLATENHAAFIRISPLLKKQHLPQQDSPRHTIRDFFSQRLHTIEMAEFQKKGFRYAPIHNMDAELCWVLDITKSEDDLLKEMRKTHRYLIKKAKTYNLEIIKTKDVADAMQFTNLYKGFSSKKHFVPHKGLVEELHVLGEDDQSLLLFAKYEGKIIAGVLIDFVGPEAVYHHAASDEQYRNIPANYLLLWESILEAKKRGKKLFNFWGIAPDENKKHPWAGFTLFKTGFGGERIEFLHAMDLPLNYTYWRSYAIDWVTRMRKGY